MHGNHYNMTLSDRIRMWNLIPSTNQDEQYYNFEHNQPSTKLPTSVCRLLYSDTKPQRKLMWSYGHRQCPAKMTRK